jgi:hypothetical protein
MRVIGLLATFLTCSACFAEQRVRKMDVYSGGGLLPQIVDSAQWKTTLYFHNMDTATVYVALYFVDDKGNPMRLPFTSGDFASASFAIEPRNTRVMESSGTGSLKQGYAAVWTCDKPCSDLTSKAIDSKLAFYAVFRSHIEGRMDSEAVVPVEMPEPDAHIVFDNRNDYSTGIALLNFMGGDITVTIRDQTGNTLATEILRIPEDEKTVFVLADKYPVTAGKYGCIEFSGSGLAAMGLRFNPGGAFTSTHAITMH